MNFSPSSLGRFLEPKLCLPLLVLLLSCSAQGQIRYEMDVFTPIPETRRARIEERLKLFVELQRTEQWGKHYDLFSAMRRRGEGKTDYINFMRQALDKGWEQRLLFFAPREVQQMQMDAKTKVWWVIGCAGMKEEGREVRRAAYVEAVWERSDWFFSGLKILSLAENPADICQ